MKDRDGNTIEIGNEVFFKYGTEQYSKVLELNKASGEIKVFNEDEMRDLWIDADRCEVQ